MQTPQSNTKKKKKHLVWIIVPGVLLLLLIVGGIEAYRIWFTPQNLFTISTMKPVQSAMPLPTPVPAGTDGTVGPQPTGVSPTGSPAGTAAPNTTSNKDILNILLIGISQGSGPDPHADGIMVAAINFKEKKVDLISLPRDTFMHVPDIMNGVYKLNASFNVGGGYGAKDGAGFLKVCQAAEYMLGGIPIDYYYGVNWESVVNLVDIIGGVDYDIESPAYDREGIGGQKHMNGEDVLFYMRVRKVGPETGDKSRVNRQKKLLIAVFDQLKKNGKLSVIPDLLNTANKSIFTNTTLEQTLALAKFMTSIDTDKIGMHSMTGTLLLKANWAYCFTDQKARQELIKQIYGVDIPEQVHCSSRYADWLVDYGFSGIRYLKTARQLLDYAASHEKELTTEQKDAYDLFKKSLDVTQAAYDRASLTFGKEDTDAMIKGKAALKTDTEKLAQLLGYRETLKWTYSASYWNDRDINEVPVDFR